MVHLQQMPEAVRNRLVNQELPDYADTPCVGGAPLSERRIAIVTTVGLHRRELPKLVDSLNQFDPSLREYVVGATKLFTPRRKKSAVTHIRLAFAAECVVLKC